MPVDDDRIPPNDLNAEQAVLGSCLLEQGPMDLAAGYLTKKDFYREVHQQVYEACLKVHRAGEAVDLVTVANALRAKNRLENCGGGEYLTALIAIVPTTANAKRYIDIVKRCSIKRETIAVAAQVTQDAYDMDVDPVESLGKHSHTLEDLQEACHPNGVPTSMSVVGAVNIEKIEDRKMRPYAISAARFGIPALDRMTGGLEDAGYCVVMADTGIGKTGFLIQVAVSTSWAIQAEITGAANRRAEAQRVADRDAMKLADLDLKEATKKVVVIFGLEEGTWRWHLRMAAFVGQFDGRETRNLATWERSLSQDTGLKERYEQAVEEVCTLPIEFAETDQTVNTIEAHCKRIARERKPILVMIDWLQLVGKSIDKAEREEQEFRVMATRLRGLSERIGCPVIGTSQVTVGSEKGARAQAQGARALEQSSDTTIYIKRARDAETEDVSPDCKLLCRKAKEFTNFGSFPCKIDKRTGRWYECSEKTGDPPDDPLEDPKQKPDRRNM